MQCVVCFFLIFITTSFGEWKFETQDFRNLKISKHYILSTRIRNESNLEQLKTGIYFNISLNKFLRYKIFIQRRKTKLINRRTKFIIFENTNSRIYPEYQTELLEGFVTEEQYASYVVGYLQKQQFYGKLQILDKLYYLEPLIKYVDIFPKYSNVTENAIAFERSYLLPHENYRNFTDMRRSVHPVLIFNIEPRNFSKRVARKGCVSGSLNCNIYFCDRNMYYRPPLTLLKVCSLLVTLDYSFIYQIHKMNIDSAIQQVLLAIDEANSLFRSTDFDNDRYPDNIGFVIKYFAVFRTPNNRNLIPYYSRQAIDGRFYIKMFSRFQLINEVCLGIIFTGQSFKNDIVGISYTAVPLKGFRLPVGGICDRPDTNPYGINLNTLAVSARNENGKNVPQFIFDLSLCHELGHSFGSDHDSTRDCDGYIMAPHTPLDENRKHFIFSSCSKKSMFKTMSLKGYCFDEDDTPYCGNNIKESTEQCDCGTVRDCLSFDICCTPHGRPNACQIKTDQGYTCHPTQGLCCTSQCRYANLQKFGVNCTNFDRTCPCTNNQTSCPCGINGYCYETVCHSEECRRIGLQECPCPKTVNGTSCRTCCFSKSSSLCSPANDVTRVLANSDFSVLNKLKSYINQQLTNDKYGFFETYCQNEECIKLFFKNVSVGSFCTLFGKLGNCEKNGCEIHSEPVIYKKMQKKSIGTMKISSPINILTILLINIFH